jgi:apolipoprotein D and lipocalin family protein
MNFNFSKPFDIAANSSRKFFRICLWLAAALSLTGCATPPATRTVAHVDLDRYLGRWYVIANVPYALERGKVASYDTYARRPDGRLDNIFTFRKGTFAAPEKSWHGVAWVVDHKSDATWHVRFIWPFYATYLVLDLDPDYQWAVVGTPQRRLIWVLARQRQLDDATYATILRRIAAAGVDTNRLVRVPQPVATP